MKKKAIFAAFVAFSTSTLAAGSALAAAGHPEPWQLGFQDMVTQVGVEGDFLHDLLLWFIAIIMIFVLGLMIYVGVKFNEKANPNPSKTTHNTLLEFAWTVIPVLILVVIAIPAFRLLYFQDVVPAKIDLTIKATGHQWYWSYEYPDHGEIEFDANIVPDDELKDGQPRLLAVDEAIHVPVNATVRVLLTSEDVLHAWAIPSFFVKKDAVPGRINEIWFKATREGTYYGQCSELCGVKHGFMPIQVEVVSKAKFDAWIARKKQEARLESKSAVKLASRSIALPASN